MGAWCVLAAGFISGVTVEDRPGTCGNGKFNTHVSGRFTSIMQHGHVTASVCKACAACVPQVCFLAWGCRQTFSQDVLVATTVHKACFAKGCSEHMSQVYTVTYISCRTCAHACCAEGYVCTLTARRRGTLRCDVDVHLASDVCSSVLC